jgi:[protein-PII] uridylyltransferase
MTAVRPISPDEYETFISSMPASYGKKYDQSAVSQHFALTKSRGEKPVRVGLIADAGKNTALCLIADDRPGLLATISGAMVHCGLDVVDAEAYTRKLGRGHFEAIDLFWVRKQSAATPGALTESDAQKLEELLSSTLLGKHRLATLVPPASADSTPLHQSDTRVRFIEDDDGGLGTLEVETGDRSGLLWSLSRALFEHRVQIITSQVRTREGRVFDRFEIVEVDGSPINETRRLEIQVAVLGAIEPARRRPSQPVGGPAAP